MNAYIYDDYLSKSRYRRALNRVEIRLTDLGLNGKIIRLGSIKNVRDAVQMEIKNGIKNIVAVGNNETANKVISAMISNKAYGLFQKDVLFSIIPIGDNNSIAHSFGITKEEEACNILLARRIKQIDIGLAGNHIFINKAELISNDAKVNVDGEYELELTRKSSIRIINLNDDKNLFLKDRVEPYDNCLNLVISGRGDDNTFVTSNNIKLSGQGELILDGCVSLPLPAEIGIIPEKINVIVGKDREFE